ncbi:MAG: hypothetical protein IAF58_18930, partial [Leptolyngbya sp.]|nr:hypothetical protein [Candidatus Melainabacteria bacterium]
AVSQKVNDELKGEMSTVNDIKMSHLALSQDFVKSTFGDLQFTDSSVPPIPSARNLQTLSYLERQPLSESAKQIADTRKLIDLIPDEKLRTQLLETLDKAKTKQSAPVKSAVEKAPEVTPVIAKPDSEKQEAEKPKAEKAPTAEELATKQATKQANLRAEWEKASPLSKEVQPKWDAIEQGQIGDCFVAATIKGVAKTPNGPEQLRDMIKQKADGSYLVKFPGSPNIVEVSQKDITPSKDVPAGARQIDGSSDLSKNWPRILEAALGRYYAEHMHPNKAGTDNPLATLNGWSGDKVEVVELLTGKKSEGADIQHSTLLDSQRQYAQETTLGMLRYLPTGVIDKMWSVDNSNNSTLSQPMLEALNKNEVMVSGRGAHAYLISKNPESGKIEILNPHGQREGTIDVTNAYQKEDKTVLDARKQIETLSDPELKEKLLKDLNAAIKKAEIVMPPGTPRGNEKDGRITIEQKDLLWFLQHNQFNNTYWMKS